MEEITNWFSQNGHPASEARKFFFHYKALDWTLSGQPIADWQAAAAKWIEHNKQNKHEKPGKLHTNNDKTYAIPL